jgi:tetratricopeptide (TPR) repeat protein
MASASNATPKVASTSEFQALSATALAEIDTLLDQVLDLDEDERERFFQQMDSSSQHYVPYLRRMIARSRVSVLDRPPLSTPTPAQPSLAVGMRLGPWQIIAPAGQGGMGEVFRAQRADGQFELTVAIKRLHAHQSSFAPRFALEREVLARLDHPHIARLVDAGVGDDGRPWFATHWIDGQDLPYWLLNAASLDERLRVFCEVASAVAYAHQLLVVHRDIKPGNVRITPSGSAVLLDFGIARLVDDADEEAQTRAPFTPDYASPEQLRGEPISTLTDVHALGLLLFEMISGTRAYANAEKNLAATVQAICFDDPPLPSVAARHGHHLPYAPNVLRGDLDAIVLRCLAKKSAQRYASARHLLDDVLRYQRREPVRARVPTIGYRFLRFAQRHRLPLAAAFIAVLALLAGIGGIVWQAGVAAKERDIARVEARRQQVLREHLMLVFREGAQASASTPVKAGTSPAKAWLDASVSQLGKFYAEDAPAHRALLLALGELYFTMNDWVAARSLLERYLQNAGDDAPQERALASAQLAQTLTRLGDLDAAEKLLDDSRSELPDANVRLDEVHASRLAARAAILRGRGKLDEAIAAQQAEIDFRRNVPEQNAHDLGIAQSNLGVSLLQANRLQEARLALLLAVQTWRADGLAHNSNLAPTLGNLANIESLLGDLHEAEMHYQEASALTANVQSAATAALAMNHARLKSLKSEHAEARKLAEAALEHLKRYAGELSMDYAAGSLAAAELALDRGDLDEATQMADHARELLAAKLPENHPLIARAEILQARCALATNPDTDLQVLHDATLRLRKAPPLLRRSVLRGELALAESELNRGNRDRAKEFLRSTHDLATELDVAPWEKAEITLWRYRVGDADTNSARAAWQVITDTFGPQIERFERLKPGRKSMS